MADFRTRDPFYDESWRRTQGIASPAQGRTRIADFIGAIPGAVEETLSSVPLAAARSVGRAPGAAKNSVERWLNAEAEPAAEPMPDVSGARGGASTTASARADGGAARVVPANGSDRAMSDQERYPGLDGAMPKRFTPEQSAQTLSSLRRNQTRFYSEPVQRAISVTSAEPGRDGKGEDGRYDHGGITVDGAFTGEDQRALDAHREEMDPLKRELNNLLRQKQVADAQAAIGFSQKYGVPADPDTMKYVATMDREQSMDRDFKAGMRAAAARLATGEYTQEDYQRAVKDLSAQWGVRRHAPDGFFRTLDPKASIQSLLDAPQ